MIVGYADDNNIMAKVKCSCISGYMTVSYTHLDGYKRQVTSISNKITQIQYYVLNATMKCITPARSQDFLFSLRQVYVVAQLEIIFKEE